MHDWVYSKAECLKNELEATGFDNLDNATLEKAYYISKILKNIVCIDKDYHIVDSMEKEEENDKIMDKVEQYTDYVGNSEHMRDMDRSKGKMYYTEPMSKSKYDMAKKHYEESKELHKANTDADKQKKSQDLEKWLNEVKDDVTSLVGGMSAEERTMAKQKLMNISNAI